MAKKVKVDVGAKLDKIEINRGDIVAKVIFPEEIWKLEKDQQLNETIDGKVFPKIIDDDKNFYRLIYATRNGLPCKSLHNAQAIMPFSTQEWAQILHVSKRSINRLKKERKKLSISQSEKLIEVTLLYDYGIDVFGSAEKFSKWLNRTNTALGGVEPKSLLDTNQGIKAVRTELSRIEYGVLA